MPDDNLAEQISGEKSPAFAKPLLGGRPARERVLPVAQIYAVVSGEPQGRSSMVTLVIGDERTPPKKHGIRACHADWCAIFRVLATEDPRLRQQLRDTVRALPDD